MYVPIDTMERRALPLPVFFLLHTARPSTPASSYSASTPNLTDPTHHTDPIHPQGLRRRQETARGHHPRGRRRRRARAHHRPSAGRAAAGLCREAAGGGGVAPPGGGGPAGGEPQLLLRGARPVRSCVVRVVCAPTDGRAGGRTDGRTGCACVFGLCVSPPRPSPQGRKGGRVCVCVVSVCVCGIPTGVDPFLHFHSKRQQHTINSPSQAALVGKFDPQTEMERAVRDLLVHARADREAAVRVVCRWVGG